MIVAAGFGSKEQKICCAAHNQKALDEMKEKYSVGIGYKGPFMGFSGLVFGLAKPHGIDAICLFAATQPTEGDLEKPDKAASDKIVELLSQMLKLPSQ
jgi:proteasome assembly chaperone (PAC2) family protein